VDLPGASEERTSHAKGSRLKAKQYRQILGGTNWTQWPSALYALSLMLTHVLFEGLDENIAK
jgi:hypothetical protein